MDRIKKNKYSILSFFFFPVHSPTHIYQGNTTYQVLEWRKSCKVPLMMINSDFTLHKGLDQCF